MGDLFQKVLEEYESKDYLSYIKLYIEGLHERKLFIYDDEGRAKIVPFGDVYMIPSIEKLTLGYEESYARAWYIEDPDCDFKFYIYVKPDFITGSKLYFSPTGEFKDLEDRSIKDLYRLHKFIMTRIQYPVNYKFRDGYLGYRNILLLQGGRIGNHICLLYNSLGLRRCIIGLDIQSNR
jgi:hypothetical protein